ncbi:serine hydrolase BPHL-like [Ptiloglossa arizonensis]|uniref:serine hydrolase BPHL-like n=1 Tax=Ptiloglossa arizonensis TaxID=3350558 RepID=UPI003F9F953B
MLATLSQSFPFKISTWLCVGIVILSLDGTKSHISMAQNNTDQERKINVDGVDINYVSVGTGEHPVLLLPGATGTIWTNFKPQIQGLSREKFTIVAWDPPGYGHSRPPERTYPENFFYRDATWARNLMKNLGHKKFSLIGWSDGGITAMILASMYPEDVRKLISVSANSYVTPQEMESYQQVRNIDVWSEEARQPLVDVYGEEVFRKLWAGWVDGIANIYQKHNGSLALEALPNIICPTLIIQGSKDAGVAAEHPMYLRDHIAGAKMKIIENGLHPVQLQFPNEFNTIVTNFLTEC